MQEIKKKRRLSKLVATKVTTAGRQRRLWAIKKYEAEEGFISRQPANTVSGDVVNKSHGNDSGL